MKKAKFTHFTLHLESSGGTLDPGAGGPGLPLMETRGIPRLHRKKFGRDFTRGKQATNAKKDAFTAWKVPVGF